MDKQSKLDEVQERLNRVLFGCYACLNLFHDEEGDDWQKHFMPLYDVVSDIVTDIELEVMIDEVRCPRDGCTFNTGYDWVMRRSESELKADEILEKASKFNPVLDVLYEHLSQFPYLGLMAPNEIGQKIVDGFKNKKGITLKDQTWFRARLLEESRLYKKEEMSAPDAQRHKVSEGRYNHSGISYLYLSESPETAFFEVKSKNQNVCAIQKYKLNALDNLLDLRTEIYNDLNVEEDDSLYALALIHNGHLHHTSDKNSSGSWKPEYLVPRFVADVARYLGFNGIVFTSVHGGHNLTLFKYSNANVVFEGEPFLFNIDEYLITDKPGAGDPRFKILDDPIF